MSLPILPQPAAGGRLCRAGPDTVAKRIGAARTGRIEVGQPEAAIHHDPTGLAMAAAPADVGAEPLVSRARDAQWRAHLLASRGAEKAVKGSDEDVLVCDPVFAAVGLQPLVAH